jgi:acyl carrier protein
VKQSEFLNLLEETIEADENSLSGKSQLEELDCWDSLAIVTFIAMVDENFDIILSPEKISKSKTIQDLILMLGDKIST